MTMRALGSCGAALLLAALVAGCSSNRYASSDDEDDCVAQPSQCKYEPGEREYAEEEAQRLNRDAAKQLRRGTGWW